MILVYKHLPPEPVHASVDETADSFEPPMGTWRLIGEMPDEGALAQRIQDGALTPGHFRIYAESKTGVSNGPEAGRETPKGWTYDRDVVIELSATPKVKIATA